MDVCLYGIVQTPRYSVRRIELEWQISCTRVWSCIVDRVHDPGLLYAHEQRKMSTPTKPRALPSPTETKMGEGLPSVPVLYGNQTTQRRKNNEPREHVPWLVMISASEYNVRAGRQAINLCFRDHPESLDNPYATLRYATNAKLMCFCSGVLPQRRCTTKLACRCRLVASGRRGWHRGRSTFGQTARRRCCCDEAWYYSAVRRRTGETRWEVRVLLLPLYTKVDS